MPVWMIRKPTGHVILLCWSGFHSCSFYFTRQPSLYFSKLLSNHVNFIRLAPLKCTLNASPRIISLLSCLLSLYLVINGASKVATCLSQGLNQGPSDQQPTEIIICHKECVCWDKKSKAKQKQCLGCGGDLGAGNTSSLIHCALRGKGLFQFSQLIFVLKAAGSNPRWNNLIFGRSITRRHFDGGYLVKHEQRLILVPPVWEIFGAIRIWLMIDLLKWCLTNFGITMDFDDQFALHVVARM